MTIAEQSARTVCGNLHLGYYAALARVVGRGDDEWQVLCGMVEKFSGMNRERLDRQDRPNLIEDLIHATATRGQYAGVKGETSSSMLPVVSQFSLADQQDTK